MLDVTLAAWWTSFVIAVVCFLATAINIVYYIRFRRHSVFAYMRLSNAVVTGYAAYAHICLMVGGPTSHVALFISALLMSLQMLAWSIVNYFYMGGDEHRLGDIK